MNRCLETRPPSSLETKKKRSCWCLFNYRPPDRIRNMIKLMWRTRVRPLIVYITVNFRHEREIRVVVCSCEWACDWTPPTPVTSDVIPEQRECGCTHRARRGERPRRYYYHPAAGEWHSDTHSAVTQGLFIRPPLHVLQMKHSKR